MDIWDKEKRSEVMAKVRSKNTTPETKLRKALFARGYRYRTNEAKLPGKPDIVFPKYKTAVFVHGCFWHGHEGCKKAALPATNTAFWAEKINANKERDKTAAVQLLSMGWKVKVVWECAIKKKNIDHVVDSVIEVLNQDIPYRSSAVSVKFYEQREETVAMVAEETVKYKRNTE